MLGRDAKTQYNLNSIFEQFPLSDLSSGRLSTSSRIHHISTKSCAKGEHCCCCCCWGCGWKGRHETSGRRMKNGKNNWFFLPDRLDTKVLINFLRTRIFSSSLDIIVHVWALRMGRLSEECEKFIFIRHFHPHSRSDSPANCPPSSCHMFGILCDRKAAISALPIQTVTCRIDCVVWITTMFPSSVHSMVEARRDVQITIESIFELFDNSIWNNFGGKIDCCLWKLWNVFHVICAPFSNSWNIYLFWGWGKKVELFHVLHFVSSSPSTPS